MVGEQIGIGVVLDEVPEKEVKSWVVEAFSPRQHRWYGIGVNFPTKAEAEGYREYLTKKWTRPNAPTSQWQVRGSREEPNYHWDGEGSGRLRRVVR